MCNPCLLSREISGPSNKWLFENAQETDKRKFSIPCEGGGIDGRDEGINSPTQNKNVLSKTTERGWEREAKVITRLSFPHSEQSFQCNTDVPRLILNKLVTKNSDRLNNWAPKH